MTISDKNTAIEPSPKGDETEDAGQRSDFIGLKGDDPPQRTEKDDAKANLEQELSDEKEARSEERFAWIAVIVILIDVLWFRNAQNVAVPFVVLFLEILILFVVARRLGLQKLELLFESLIHNLGRKG